MKYAKVVTVIMERTRIKIMKVWNLGPALLAVGKKPSFDSIIDQLKHLIPIREFGRIK